MPVFRLSDAVIFPSPHLSEEDGLLAIGGDLSIERILKAYSMGIFPWYSKGSPILWWSPDPRLVLFPDELRVSRSLSQCIRKGIFSVTLNTAFEEVIHSCAVIRRQGQAGTWITKKMIDAYIGLHHIGYAHSVEAWHGNVLAGGLYGIILGRIFFGESMFSNISNASKVAFVTFVRHLQQQGFRLIDCQVSTEHLRNFGAREISRSRFLQILDEFGSATQHTDFLQSRHI
jgi:leucyl/phenylalanyl-tRNA--protein transferase